MNPIEQGGKILVQFDGICILCSQTVKFILKFDRKGKFLFQSLQNASGNEVADSVIVFDGQTNYIHFDAILKIGKELGGLFRIVAIFKLIPRKYRNSLYLLVARNRYKWFGVRKSCFMPSVDNQHRFI